MSALVELPKFERFGHYKLNTGPTHEFGIFPSRRPPFAILAGRWAMTAHIAAPIATA